MFFVRTAEQEHRHFVIFVPGEKSRREEGRRGAAAVAVATAAAAFFKSRFEVLCTDYKSVIREHEWKE